MIRHRTLTLFAALSCNVAAFAQVTWTQAAPASSPPARMLHAMAFDSQRGVVVLHGGTTWTSTTWFNDTWEWNGSAWLQRFSANVPPADPHPVMAYDSARGRTVLVNATGQTWEWDGTNWQQQVTPGPPMAGYAASMAFDSVRQRTVWVGESPTLPNAAEIWEWDGTTWTAGPPLGGLLLTPPLSLSVSLAFDSTRARSVLSSNAGTWEWDGSAWSHVSPEHGGGGQRSLVFDSLNGRCVSLSLGASSRLWNGTYWIGDGAVSGPPTVLFAAFAYDSARNVTVRFGGILLSTQSSPETWERTAIHVPSSVATFGTGCGNPVVVLAPVPTAPPVIGQTTTATIQNAFLGLAFVAWGTSNTTWGTATLPLPLGPFGFQGCTLLQSADLALGAPCSSTSSSTALHAVLIPNAPGLLGLTLYLQAWTLQPGFNPNGIITSNGLALTIGDA